MYCVMLEWVDGYIEITVQVHSESEAQKSLDGIKHYWRDYMDRIKRLWIEPSEKANAIMDAQSKRICERYFKNQ